MVSSRSQAVKVLAVVVARGRSQELGEVLAAVGHGERTPDHLIVVNVGAPAEAAAVAALLKETLARETGLEENSREESAQFPAWVIDVPVAKNFGDAIRQALTSESVEVQPEYLWLLHDDSKPHPRALAQLVARAERGGTVAAVGAKQVEWGEPSQLLEVGIEATRGARRLPLTSVGEIDQGQYDDRAEVLAVGSAGMLVRSAIWHATRGFDPHLGPFGDGLEYGRRLRRAGYRVVVEPRAVIEHARKSYVPGQYSRIREAQLYNWLVASRFGAPLFIVLALAVWTPLRALGRLVSRQPRMAGAEIMAYLRLLRALPAVGRARRRQSRGAAVPASALVPLEATSKELRQRRRSLRRAAKTAPENRRDLGVLGEQAWARARRRERGWFLAIVLVFAGASFVVWYRYFPGIVGANWANLPGTWPELWQQSWSYWVASGSGSPGPVNPLLPALSILALPLWLLGVSPYSFAVALMVAAWPLAFIGGWVAASVLSRSLAVRVAFGLLWVGLPPLTLALSAGDLGQVVSWLFTPFVFACMWLAFRGPQPYLVQGLEQFVGYRKTDPLLWSAWAGLALIVAAGAAPGLVLFAGVAAYLLALLPGQQGSADTKSKLARRALGATLVWLPAAVWVFPSWKLDWFSLLTPTEQPVPSFTTPAPLILGLVALGVLVVGAVSALVVTTWSSRANPWVCRIAFTFAGLAVASAASVYGWSLAPASIWSVVCLSLGASAISAIGPVWWTPRGVPSPGFATRSWLGVAGAAGGLAGAVALFLVFFGSPWLSSASIPAIPRVAVAAQESPAASRLLLLDATGDGANVALWRGIGRQQVDLSAGAVAGSAGDGDLAQAVAEITVTPSDQAALTFANHAVELVLVSEAEANETLRENLDTSARFERIGTTELGAMWRVRPDGMTPGRVMLEKEIIPSSTVGVSTQIAGEPGVITLAEAADEGWVATFQGEQLEPTTVQWQQAFRFPGGDGKLTVSYRPVVTAAWMGLSLAAGALLVVLAIPWRVRRTQWEESQWEETQREDAQWEETQREDAQREETQREETQREETQREEMAQEEVAE